MNRCPLDLLAPGARPIQTPWGAADFATEYAPGLVLYSTPGHGGFHVSPYRLALMPEPYRSHSPFCREAGWYEEDCDWAVVALAFPQFFTETELEAARRMWSWMMERKTQDFQPQRNISAALRAQDLSNPPQP